VRKKIFSLWLCLLLGGCHAEWQTFFAPQFEDIWWQPVDLEWCFNFHYSESGDHELLLYENDKIQNYGQWIFEEPNTYIVEDYSITVWENEGCWDLEIEPFNVMVEDLYACECRLR